MSLSIEIKDEIGGLVKDVSSDWGTSPELEERALIAERLKKDLWVKTPARRGSKELKAWLAEEYPDSRIILQLESEWTVNNGVRQIKGASWKWFIEDIAQALHIKAQWGEG